MFANRVKGEKKVTLSLMEFDYNALERMSYEKNLPLEIFLRNIIISRLDLGEPMRFEKRKRYLNHNEKAHC